MTIQFGNGMNMETPLPPLGAKIKSYTVTDIEQNLLGELINDQWMYHNEVMIELDSQVWVTLDWIYKYLDKK